MARARKPIPLGQHSSGWYIIQELDSTGKNRVIRGICPCGREVDARYHKLSTTYRCLGCKSERRVLSIPKGTLIGGWEIIKEENKIGRHRLFKCSCTYCGSSHVVYLSNMRRTHSNGCDTCSHKQSRNEGIASKDENGKRDPIYDKWFRVRDRCYNPNNNSFIHYGGRGITMSTEFLENKQLWINYLKGLPNFGNDEYTSIDRIDNDGNYERGNLRWATPTMQANNKVRKGETDG